MPRFSGCVALVLIGLAVLIGGGAMLTGIVKVRTAQDRKYCENNLRQLALFAAVPPPAAPDAVGPVRTAVPPGTVFNPALPADRRLSWVADALPVFDARQQDAAKLGREIDRALAWDAGPNAAAARTRLGVLTDYGTPAAVTPGDPAVTQYVGVSGIDPGAAELGLGPPVPSKAGCFRYDGPTPYSAIADGLSQSLLFAETARHLGPWLRGGPSTVRGLAVGTDAPAPVGVGGQFGGNHVGGGNFGIADGSVRFLSDRISSDVFRGLATIAGGPDEMAME